MMDTGISATRFSPKNLLDQIATNRVAADNVVTRHTIVISVRVVRRRSPEYERNIILKTAYADTAIRPSLTAFTGLKAANSKLKRSR